MRRREFMLGLASAVLNSGFAPLEAVAGSATSYQLGSSAVTLNVFASSAGKTTYFAPHEDESTSLAVAKAAVKAHGGRVFWFSHGGGRYINFKMSGKDYKVDPNRIFSNRGAKASLTTLGAYSDEALREVRVFADQVLSQVFSNAGLIVGMHNNTNGGNYSVASYLVGGKPTGEASKVFVAEGADSDDFFFTNREPIYNKLKARGFTVVLQKARPTDDGSLSVRSPLPYVNIEAQHGHSSMQKRMLDTLLSI